MIKVIKKIGRKYLDRLQYSYNPAAKMLGKDASWCIDSSLLKNKPNPIMFSGGAGNDISFEIDFIEKYNGTVYLYDPSPTGQKTLEKFKNQKSLYFINKALSNKNGAILMDKPVNSDEGSWTIGIGGNETDSFESISLLEEIKNKGYSTVDIVKLDIEGFEYEVLDELLDSQLEIRQILLEFHDFFPNISISKSLNMRLKFLKKGYKCFYKRRYDFSYLKKP